MVGSESGRGMGRGRAEGLFEVVDCNCNSC